LNLHHNQFLGPWNDEHQPVFCPPSPDCLLRRLQSSANICRASQGHFEPVICPPGYYCPPPGTQQLKCLRGHFCPLGTVTPFKCTALSICGEGSSHPTPLLALVLCVLLDILICGICILFQSSSPSRKLSRYLFFKQPPPHLPVDEGEYSNDAICLQPLDGLLPYNGTGLSLDLTFTGINLRLGRPPRDILSDVHGAIRSGTVFGIIGASGSGKCEYLSSILVRTVLISPAPQQVSLIYYLGDHGRHGEKLRLMAAQVKQTSKLPISTTHRRQNSRACL
jgi:hypothetical protein